MNPELQKALAAIKAKDAEGAKLILARLLQEEPDNVAAWVLMSRMAETDVQKAAFLRKILALEPDHAYARKELAALQATAGDGETAATAEPEPETPAADGEPRAGEGDGEPEAHEETEEVVAEAEAPAIPPETGLPLSTDPFDYEAQAEGDTLPPWMADEEVILEAPEPAAPEAAEEETPPPEIPDWLAEEPESEWLKQGVASEETEAAAQAGEVNAPPATPQPPAATGIGSGLLLGLTVITIIVFLLLVYAAITFLPDFF